MDWITDTLAIGGLKDLIDWSGLEDAGIESVLQLYAQEKERPEIPLPLEVLQLSVEDRRALPIRQLTQGVRFIRRQQAAGRPTLVCCGAGMSRSPVFVAAYLHEEGMELEAAFRLIRERRPIIRPHPRLVQSLEEHYGLTAGAEDPDDGAD